MITSKEIREKEIASYWRGFNACIVFIVIPFGIAFVLFCNSLVTLLS